MGVGGTAALTASKASGLDPPARPASTAAVLARRAAAVGVIVGSNASKSHAGQARSRAATGTTALLDGR